MWARRFSYFNTKIFCLLNQTNASAMNRYWLNHIIGWSRCACNFSCSNTPFCLERDSRFCDCYHNYKGSGYLWHNMNISESYWNPQWNSNLEQSLQNLLKTWKLSQDKCSLGSSISLLQSSSMTIQILSFYDHLWSHLQQCYRIIEYHLVLQFRTLLCLLTLSHEYSKYRHCHNTWTLSLSSQSTYLYTHSFDHEIQSAIVSTNQDWCFCRIEILRRLLGLVRVKQEPRETCLWRGGRILLPYNRNWHSAPDRELHPEPSWKFRLGII